MRTVNLSMSKMIKSRVPSEIIMVVLHGKGDSVAPFEEFAMELKMPELNLMLVQAPQKFMGGFSWYKEPPKMEEEIIQSRELVMQTINNLLSEGWKEKNIFIFGFSQGCLMGLDTVLQLNRELGGFIGISGYFNFFPRWEKKLSRQVVKTPILLTHGFRDTTLPMKITKFGSQKLVRAGFLVTWLEFNKGHVLKEFEYKWIRNWINDRIKYLRDETLNDSRFLNRDLAEPTASVFARSNLR